MLSVRRGNAVVRALAFALGISNWVAGRLRDAVPRAFHYPATSYGMKRGHPKRSQSWSAAWLRWAQPRTKMGPTVLGKPLVRRNAWRP